MKRGSAKGNQAITVERVAVLFRSLADTANVKGYRVLYDLDVFIETIKVQLRSGHSSPELIRTTHTQFEELAKEMRAWVGQRNVDLEICRALFDNRLPRADVNPPTGGAVAGSLQISGRLRPVHGSGGDFSRPSKKNQKS